LLVGSEESDELWESFNTDESNFVDIEVSPGSWEIGVKVFLNLSSGELFVSSENFSRGTSGLGFGHGEDTVWRSIGVLSFSGVVHDHGSHEEVIGGVSELDWEDSLVFLIEWTGSVISGLEEFSRVVNFISDGDGVGDGGEGG